MCSILNAMNQLKLNHGNSQSVTLSSENDLLEWCYALNFFARLLAYVGVLAVMVLIVLLILKYMTDFSDESGYHQEDMRAATESETTPLCSDKAIPLTYGTCEEDEETGSCSSGEDLYDGRICVICYDEQRNCFFVPCGHCATCYDCAQRIYDGENKVCPVCRRVIGKVRKLFAP
ncbi:baculoviral IAP repeat-containing protein 7-A-like [Durio zibethinus]|uniref:Baculoviral IAP repeat-containing protein 7-A-like n=1 Tax=Durio zibethinus TaxID=66656 RepID=A0A6P5ZHS0_DURZI|nr:baculoviral IAP repeat-containing protein 7-A-like [Durio zibethinus]XP_022752083.1 baculoviral IAP repeat-containing protein 7-A-like [Durio zibethinus]